MTAILPNPFGGDDYLTDQRRAVVPTTYRATGGWEDFFATAPDAPADEHRFVLDVDLFCADIGLDPLPIFLRSIAP